MSMDLASLLYEVKLNAKVESPAGPWSQGRIFEDGALCQSGGLLFLSLPGGPMSVPGWPPSRGKWKYAAKC